ncbi:MAG TPA: YidB family protein [Noviherbaspirillum sp.]|jgi:uncharacterized protein YidB (DUF937 family)|nr:YidB family protein [Noviherbaspirillum sp.]
MGLLDRAFEMLGNQHLPMMDARTKLLQSALALLANNGQAGGLHGLMERFQEAGLGNVIKSWIGPGSNMPITGTQMQQVLDEGQLQQISEETGLTEEETAVRLSDMLPELIDQFTPDGQVPPGGLGNMSTLLDHFMGRYH